MHSHAPACQSVTREQLAVLLEDALSAEAGWTVPPPTIHLLHSDDASTNWTVDLGEMDDPMRDIVTRMQRRYRVQAPPAGWRARLARLLTGHRGPAAECRA